MFRKLLPVQYRLMTWELKVNFDEIPSESFVLESFCRDMPNTIERLGGCSGIRLWPMVHFNSQEGRKYRYLAAIPMDESQNVLAVYARRKWLKPRLVPRQFALYGLADQIMKNAGDDRGGAEHFGNNVFWSIYDGVMYVLVFFEGRLCHWSEENGYDAESGDAQLRLARLEKFLTQDDLFSRGKSFLWQEVEFPKNDVSLKTALKDSFVKGCVLESPSVRNLGIRNFGVAICFMIAALCLVFFCHRENCEEIPDVAPIELLASPSVDLQPEYFEERSDEDPQIYFQESKARNVQPLNDESVSSCQKPPFRLKGIVGNRLVMVERNGYISTLARNDSLENFVISSIERDRIFLACGDMLEEVLVQ